MVQVVTGDRTPRLSLTRMVVLVQRRCSASVAMYGRGGASLVTGDTPSIAGEPWYIWGMLRGGVGPARGGGAA